MSAKYYWRGTMGDGALLTMEYSNASELENIEAVSFRIDGEVVRLESINVNTEHEIDKRMRELIPQAKYKSSQKFRVTLAFLERIAASDDVRIRLHFLGPTYMNQNMTSQHAARTFLQAVAETRGE